MAAEGPVEVGSEVGSALISALGSMGSALPLRQRGLRTDDHMLSLILSLRPGLPSCHW